MGDGMAILAESQLEEIERKAHALFGPTAEGPWAYRPLPLEVVDRLLASHRELRAEVERLRVENEYLALNLCPHSIRYGRTCDDGPSDDELQEFLSRTRS